MFVRAHALWAAEGALEVDDDENLRSILDRQAGQMMGGASGAAMSPVEAGLVFGDKLLHLSLLSGQKFL